MKEKVCYKYIVRDNQQLCFDDYILTPKHYSSKKACERDFGFEKTEFCFRVICPLRRTKQTGKTAEILTRHEGKHR